MRVPVEPGATVDDIPSRRGAPPPPKKPSPRHGRAPDDRRDKDEVKTRNGDAGLETNQRATKDREISHETESSDVGSI